MNDLHQELAKAVPGSEEERAILERARARRGQSEDEIVASRAVNLLAAAPDARQIIPSGPAQNAAHTAIEHVTGEHQIPAQATGQTPGEDRLHA